MTRAAHRAVPLLALLPFLLSFSCAHVGDRSPGPPVLEIDRDTAWSGEVRVDGIVHVRSGATLTILPGTRISYNFV